MGTATVRCEDKTTREINREIRQRVAEGCAEIAVLGPAARHSLGVAIVDPVKIHFGGSVGYYCAGMIDGAEVTIDGSAGWGLGESMLGGTVVVEGSAGNGAAAAMRGGTVVIKGDAGARAGVSLKGGTLIIAGGCGYMTGFMAQKGTIILCGDADEALADSMYEAVVYVGGNIADLGHDAVHAELTEADRDLLRAALLPHGLDAERDWKKIIAGRKLWNFDKDETTWHAIL
jgi:glutamate synthase domain-containing protein 3